MIKRKINIYMVDEPIDTTGLVEVFADLYMKELNEKQLKERQVKEGDVCKAGKGKEA